MRTRCSPPRRVVAGHLTINHEPKSFTATPLSFFHAGFRPRRTIELWPIPRQLFTRGTNQPTTLSLFNTPAHLPPVKTSSFTTIEIAASSMQTSHSSINAPLAETATSLLTVSATNSFGFSRLASHIAQYHSTADHKYQRRS